MSCWPADSQTADAAECVGQPHAWCCCGRAPVAWTKTLHRIRARARWRAFNKQPTTRTTRAWHPPPWNQQPHQLLGICAATCLDSGEVVCNSTGLIPSQLQTHMSSAEQANYKQLSCNHNVSSQNNEIVQASPHSWLMPVTKHRQWCNTGHCTAHAPSMPIRLRVNPTRLVMCWYTQSTNTGAADTECSSAQIQTHAQHPTP